MKAKRTQNPYDGALDEVKRHSAWRDGYACGHDDAEMDARGNAADLEIHASNQAHEITRQALEISNLVEKNDNQRDMIMSQDESDALSFKRGHHAGVDAAVSDMVVFAQSRGSTVKFLTSDQYDTLVKVAAELGVMDDRVSDLGAVIAEHVVTFDETLGDIECPPR